MRRGSYKVQLGCGTLGIEGELEELQRQRKRDK